MLGVSRQRVAQLMATHDDFPKPEVELVGGRVWSRTAIEAWINAHPERSDEEVEPETGFMNFDDPARRVIVLAQEQARLFKHNYIGTEHLLLGLLKLEDGAAWRALHSLDVTIGAVGEQLENMIGFGGSTPEGHLPYTPRTKTVLELALREAKALADPVISTQHILLAIVREKDGVACQILDKLGLSMKEVRKVTLEAAQSWVQPKRARRRDKSKDDLFSCSFCGKPQTQVEKLIAGPGVYICNECVDLCKDIITEEMGQHGKERDLQLRIDDLERRLDELEQK